MRGRAGDLEASSGRVRALALATDEPPHSHADGP